MWGEIENVQVDVRDVPGDIGMYGEILGRMGKYFVQISPEEAGVQILGSSLPLGLCRNFNSTGYDFNYEILMDDAVIFMIVINKTFLNFL